MSKYISNNLSDFEFHDAYVLDSCIDENKTLSFKVKYLNIHKNIEQNTNDYDMEIELANLIFEDFKFISYEHGGSTTYDDKGQFLYKEPSKTLTDADGFKAFEKVFKKGFTILYLSDENSVCYMEGCGPDPYFILNFSFSKATVSWESFKEKAWYEKFEFKNS